MSRIRRALVSVSDKTGIVDFCRALVQMQVQVLSTGGTANLLRAHGLPVTEVSAYTGFPEVMGGRVKTLHPKIHGGILARRGEDEAVMAAHGIEPIDLVVVNLYPFEATVARGDCTLALALENIDIGGPCLLRAAAKNHHHVAVVVDPADYHAVIEEMRTSDGRLAEDSRYSLAAKAFEHTARYDAAISNYLNSRKVGGELVRFPRTLTLQLKKLEDLRYGENPHQRAAFYSELEPPPGSIVCAEQLQGKQLSFNNIADADAALDCAAAFDEPVCVIVKHANPCGVAVGQTLPLAYERAYAADPTSAFGGVIALNRTLEEATARTILERQYVEVIVAPAVDAQAAAVLARKPEVRVLAVGAGADRAPVRSDMKRVSGGLLVQDQDLPRATVDLDDLKIVSRRAPTDHEIRDLFFAWRVVRCVKSNAIVLARDLQTIGIGAGQMSRIFSVRIAVLKAEDAGLETRGAVMASDAFFPFRDAIDRAAAAGVTAVIQPGGSIRDEEVIAAADEHGLAMVFTGMRHFRH